MKRLEDLFWSGVRLLKTFDPFFLQTIQTSDFKHMSFYSDGIKSDTDTTLENECILILEMGPIMLTLQDLVSIWHYIDGPNINVHILPKNIWYITAKSGLKCQGIEKGNKIIVLADNDNDFRLKTRMNFQTNSKLPYKFELLDFYLQIVTLLIQIFHK